MKKLDLPPFWTFFALILIVVINLVLPQPSVAAYIKPWMGYILMISGWVLVIWSQLTFKKANTTIHPKKAPRQLVTSGPFSFSRHPIYTAMILFSLGAAIVTGSVFGFLPVVGLFFILRDRFVKYEEKVLLDQFPAEAEDYFSKTRRW